MPRRHNVQVYSATIKSAALSHEFGQQLAGRWFGKTVEDVVQQFGVFSRGPRKGLPRGRVVWVKVVEGGWCYDLQRVMRPGAVYGAMVSDAEAATLIAKRPSELFRLLPSVNTAGAVEQR